MNPGNLARALNQSHPRPFPVVNSHTVGGRGSGVGLEPQPMMYPVMVVPYGGSYMYVPAQPVAYYNPYAPFRGTMPTMAPYSSYGHSEAPTSVYRPHSSFKENKKGFVRKNHSMGNTVAINPLIDSPVFPQIQNYGFNSTLREEDAENYEEDEAETESVAGPRSADTMTVEELYRHITNHLKNFPRIRISWFNKLLVKVQTPQEFARALDTLEVFTQRIIDVSPETGTLFIKAACRAKVPEKALLILKALDKVRIWPTLGGIHYLMINFALKNDTQSVKEAFRVAKLRELKPNVRTYQIIIRECVDNNLIDDALGYLTECETLNIIPNRVTYNILMNGLRKANRPKEILQIRQKMDKHGLEINDTTVKFTSMAYMMLGDAQNAVTEFLKYPDVATKMSEFSSKFFELTEGPDALQKKCVVDLFDALAARGVAFPADLQEQLQKAKSAGWA